MIDADEVQSLLLRPSHAPEIDIRFLRFGDQDQIRRVLRAAAEAVTVASEAHLHAERWSATRRGPHPGAVAVGVTAAGIQLAGVDPRALAALPLAFRRGMRAAADRLGDHGPSAPTHWEPPFDDAAPVHLVALRAGTDGWGALGPHVADQPGWTGARRPDHSEPFGFRDDISDPVIDGSGKAVTPGNGVWDAERGAWRAVRAGEAVLGHLDESGAVAGHPDAAPLERDGTYLVLRRLEQDVQGFWAACERWAGALGAGAEDVAAGMVGRRRDGTVLGRELAPHDSPPDNGFLYRTGACPAAAVPPSAHIRRANPRDSIFGAERIVRRHHLFRRGYPYRDGEREGLLFLACCADLARQFEFTQAEWIEDGNRFGLGAERDPLIGNRAGSDGAASIDLDGRRIRREGLPSFVTTRGGEYVLLPSRSSLRRLADGRA